MSLEKPEYVSDLIVYLLNGLGVDYIPLNPGATTRAIHESAVNFGGNRAPEIITCCHEEIAVAMAEGYYLATSKGPAPPDGWPRRFGKQSRKRTGSWSTARSAVGSAGSGT